MRTVGYRLALVLMRAWWVVRRPRSSGVRCALRRAFRRHSTFYLEAAVPGAELEPRPGELTAAA